MLRVASGQSVSLLVALWLAASPAWALDVNPGLWEISIDGSASGQKACLTRELLDADFSDIQMPTGVECNYQVLEKTPEFVTSHTECTGEFSIVGDTRVDVHGPGSMTMKSTSIMSVAGQQQTFNTTIDYKWLSSDCGDVKPVNLGKPLE
jgi:Protein of unknown function (DUF3617)